MKKMTSGVLILVCGIFLLGLKCAQAKPAKPAWFLGTWQYSSCDEQKIMCQVKNFTFKSDNTYEIKAYPEAHHEGRYQIAEGLTETKATLKLSHQKGDWAPWKSQIIVTHSDLGDTITIDGEGPYSVAPKVMPEPKTSK